jgi:hypothetical protein
VLLIHKGRNYGFPLREGGEVVSGERRAPTCRSRMSARAGDRHHHCRNRHAAVSVLRYGHGQAGGDAIAGGFVLQRQADSAADGKFVFGDISTGRLWWATSRTCERPTTVWRGRWRRSTSCRSGGTIPPMLRARAAAVSDDGAIVTAAYHARGGRDPDLPGTGAVAGPGRVDLRFAIDPRAGELYLLSKSDGVIVR